MKEGPQSAPRPRPGATKCPYCHDECAATGDECVCAECLSRHHRRCWDEGSGCSSCRSTRRLEAVASSSPESSAGRYADAIDAWLRLALVYNGVLAAVTILTVGHPLFHPRNLFQVGFGAVIANVCFLLGPATELVVRRLGGRNTRVLRWLLFVPGLLAAMLLAFLCGLFGAI